METEYPEAMVEDVGRFLTAVPDAVDSDDRHVVAAAIAGKADAIVTNDIDDIPADAVSVVSLEVQSLDAFLLNQLALDQDTVHAVFAELENDLQQPPMTIDEVLDALAQHAPGFAAAMREEMASA